MHIIPPALAYTKKEVTRLSLHEHIEELKELQNKRNERSYSQENARISINSKLPIGIVLTSDWHIGSEGTDYETWERHMELIKNEPFAFMACLSNTIDNYIWPGGMLSELVHTSDQQEIIKQFAHDYKNKIIAIVGSRCHEGWTSEKVGLNPNEIMFRELIDDGTPWLSKGGVVEIDLNGTVYSIGLVHKARFHSALNPTNANKRMMDLRWPVDISAIAHHHVANIEQTTRWEGPYKKEVVLVRTGTYKIKDGYSELEGFGQGQVGGAMVVLFPDTKKMVPFIRIEDGMEYLKLLRK